MNTLKEQGLSIPPSKAKNVLEETKNPKENIGSASCGREGQNIPGETTTPEETQCLTRAEAKPQNAPENRGLLKTTGARCSRQRITRCFGTDSHFAAHRNLHGNNKKDRKLKPQQEAASCV
jgi:hypothetical protein